MSGPTAFFAAPDEDDLLESRNQIFWDALLDHIRRDGFARMPRKVLDIGCHRGGLLARVADAWGAEELWGIEPIVAARSRAQLRLAAAGRRLRLLDPSEWHLVPDSSMDLVVCHEVLFLIENLTAWTAQIARVLAPRARAYVVAGCHGENPVWPAWREELRRQGKTVFTHEPLDLMAAAGACGLIPAVRPLRDSGWAIHDPSEGAFVFPTVTALLDHQFRQKLLFRLVRQ